MNTIDSIGARRTQKVLADSAWPIKEDSELESLRIELLELAAKAPYHYKCDPHYRPEIEPLNSSLPFRFYVLNSRTCRDVANYTVEHDIKSGIVTNMLNAADLLFLVTWLPNIEDRKTHYLEEPVPFEGNLENMEHIASASAAVQNVLLGATTKGIPSYWSSGGPLRENELRSKLGIPMDQILLGAIFLFPGDSESRADNIKTGALRALGKEPNSWSTRVQFSNE